MMKKIGLFITLLLLTACASVINPKSLTAITGTKPSVHVKTFLYHQMHGLKEGEYVAEYSDKNGTFYRGPDNCATMNGMQFPGGVYISMIKGKKEYQVYWYIHTELKNPSPVGKLIVNSEEGEIGLLSPTTEIDISSYVSVAP